MAFHVSVIYAVNGQSVARDLRLTMSNIGWGLARIVFLQYFSDSRVDITQVNTAVCASDA